MKVVELNVYGKLKNARGKSERAWPESIAAEVPDDFELSGLDKQQLTRWTGLDSVDFVYIESPPLFPDLLPTLRILDKGDRYAVEAISV